LRFYLYPAGRAARGLSPGTAIVLHQKGQVIARATVIEPRAPRA
jgi:hypothetical protein